MAVNPDFHEFLSLPFDQQVVYFNEKFRRINFKYVNDPPCFSHRGNKKCKFCNEEYPKVTFNQVAHLIPEFFGNHTLVSDFECDACNKLFGVYENQLSKFFGHSITVNGTRGKANKIPNSQSGDSKTHAKKGKFLNGEFGIFFGNSTPDGQNVKYVENLGLIEISSNTEKYIPVSIFKAMAKMALGLLPFDKRVEYEEIFEFLQDKRHRSFIPNSAFWMASYNFSLRYEKTAIFLFEGKAIDGNLNELCFVLLYEQYMFQIFIPQSLKIPQSNQRNIICPVFPPILPLRGISGIQTSFNRISLNSIIPTMHEHKYFVKIPPNLGEGILIDIETGEEKDEAIDPNNFRQLILIPKEKKFAINKGKQS